MTLRDDEIRTIATNAATANQVPVQAVSTSPVIDSAGWAGIEIVISIPPGSSFSIMGGPSARTVSQVIRELADAGEERFPIVQFGETSAP
jgi:hypothetical protein